jgi:hypothetical protein
LNIFSALIILYEHCIKSGLGSYSTPEEKDLQELGNTGLDNLVNDIVTFATHIQMILPYNLDQASPLVANCLYRIAVRLSKKSNPEPPLALDYMKETLYKLGARWRVGSMKDIPFLMTSF